MDQQRIFNFKKKWGQNFFLQPDQLASVISELGFSEQKNIWEIGVGQGVLTKILLEKGFKVYAFEIDTELIEDLHKRFHVEIATQQLVLIVGNFFHLAKEYGTEFEGQIIANIPYNIITRLFFFLYEEAFQINKMFLSLPQDVVNKIVPSQPPFTGALNVLIQSIYWLDKKIELPPHYFIPQPKIISWGIYFQSKPRLFPYSIDFSQLLKILFTYRRKKIINALKFSSFYEQVDEYFQRNRLYPPYLFQQRIEQVPLDFFYHLACSVSKYKKKIHL